MDDWKRTERETLLAAGVGASTASLLVAWASMWNEGDFNRLDEWVAADFRFNEVLLGLDGIRAMVDPTTLSVQGLPHCDPRGVRGR